VLTITAATSLVISSGSSMGVAAATTPRSGCGWSASTTPARSGSARSTASVGTDIYPLSAWGIASSTAEGGAGAADSAQTFYTGTAVAAKAYVPLGYMTWETGLAAAGTWSAGPTRAQLYRAGVPLPGTVVGSGASNRRGGDRHHDYAVRRHHSAEHRRRSVSVKGDHASSAANLLRVKAVHDLAVAKCASDGTRSRCFQDSVANALGDGDHFEWHGDSRPRSDYRECSRAGDIPTAFKVRAGGHAAGTTTINGGRGARFGGVAASYLRIEEIAT
jgi:hypothetical protein